MAGVIRVMGAAAPGVEVLYLAGASVVGTTRTDAEGRFALAPTATAVMARFVTPFVGVAVRTDLADGVELDIDRAQIVRLTGTIQVPATTAFDWVDVKLTPRVDVPPRVVLHDDGGMREAYWIRRYVQPTFDLRVLKGLWEVRASREIDGPLPVQRGNLTLAAVGYGAQSPAPRFMGFEITIDGNAELELQMTSA